MYCKKCGKEINNDALFCPYCGTSVNGETLNTTSVKSKPKPVKKSTAECFGWAILGFIIPVVGLILRIVWKDDKPGEGSSAGKGALVSVIAGVVVSIIMIIVSAVMAGSSMYY